MMNLWGELPTTIEVNGHTYKLRTDYRVVLDVLTALGDPNLFEPGASEREKNIVRTQLMLKIMIEDFDDMAFEDFGDAAGEVMKFIDCGSDRKSEKKKPKIMDWEQDAPFIIPAINNVANTEVRSIPYLHWWTFFGYYMEIKSSLYSQILNIRYKKAKHKKLEQQEKDFYNENKEVIDLHYKKTDEELEEDKELEEFFANWGG